MYKKDYIVYTHIQTKYINTKKKAEVRAVTRRNRRPVAPAIFCFFFFFFKKSAMQQLPIYINIYIVNIASVQRRVHPEEEEEESKLKKGAAGRKAPIYQQVQREREREKERRKKNLR